MTVLAAILMGGRPRADFIGWSTGDQTSTTITLHANARAGDFLIVEYYQSGRSLSGGAGIAFTNVVFGNVKLSYRRITTADLSTPITVNLSTPFISGVWRGPSDLSAARSANSGFSGTTSYTITGFTKGSTAIGLFAAGSVSDCPVYFTTGTEFPNNTTRASSGIGFGAGSRTTTFETYVDGTAFHFTTDTASAGDAKIFELLV